MRWENFNKGWKFIYQGNAKGIQAHKEMEVDLPHDFSILTERIGEADSGFAGGYYQGGTGIYKKEFTVRDEQQYMALVLDGAYMITEVYVNGNLVSFHPNGYTQQIVYLTPWLKEGKNEVKIFVINDALPNSRWYTGSGIYRDVWLVSGKKWGLLPHDITVETLQVSEKKSSVRIRTRIRKLEENEKKERNGNVKGILITQIKNEHGMCCAHTQCEISLSDTNWEHEWREQVIEIEDAKLWSMDNPHLYTISQTIEINMDTEDVVDTCSFDFGIRLIQIDSLNGLILNGKPTKLRGGCIHHDNGILGSCAFRQSEYRKIQKMKALGYNAVRTAHNPPSSYLLEACDRLGMAVIDEFYDQWTIKKNTHDYHLFFRDWWKRDIRSIVERDRNHPSVFMWSTGNEIVERDGNSNGYMWSKMLADEVHKYDATRAVTNGICAVFLENGEFGGLLGNIFNGSAGDIEDYELEYPGLKEEYKRVMDKFEELTEAFAEPLDIVGYNYLDDFYERGHKKYPERIICGTESYPRSMKKIWDKINHLPYVIGDFSWTALDYLGESGVGRAEYGHDKLNGLFGQFPWHVSGCGDIDICGFVKAQGEYRKRMWTREKTPFIFVERPENKGKKEILSPWGWEEGISKWDFEGHENEQFKVTVYTVSPKVVLFLNGVKIADAQKKRGIGKLDFEVPYIPGTLEAAVYDGDKEVGRTILKTPGNNLKIRIEPERTPVEGELIYLIVSVADEENNTSYSQVKIRVEIEGEAVLAAFGNGNPKGEESYQSMECNLYDGHALLVLRKRNKGKVYIKAVAEEGTYLKKNVRNIEACEYIADI